MRRNQTGPVFSPPVREVQTLTGERGIDSVLFRVEALGKVDDDDAANERPGSGIIDLRALLASGPGAARPRVLPGGDLLAVYSASRSPTPLAEPFPWRRALGIALASLVATVIATLVLWMA
jgi:hypothetical protein